MFKIKYQFTTIIVYLCLMIYARKACCSYRDDLGAVERPSPSHLALGLPGKSLDYTALATSIDEALEGKNKRHYLYICDMVKGHSHLTYRNFSLSADSLNLYKLLGSYQAYFRRDNFLYTLHAATKLIFKYQPFLQHDNVKQLLIFIDDSLKNLPNHQKVQHINVFSLFMNAFYNEPINLSYLCNKIIELHLEPEKFRYLSLIFKKVDRINQKDPAKIDLYNYMSFSERVLNTLKSKDLAIFYDTLVFASKNRIQQWIFKDELIATYIKEHLLRTDQEKVPLSPCLSLTDSQDFSDVSLESEELILMTPLQEKNLQINLKKNNTQKTPFPRWCHPFNCLSPRKP
jgi:hypothetical protein